MSRLKRRMRMVSGGWALVLMVVGVVGLATSAQAQILSGDLSDELFGRSVAWAGDVDGDGRDDFLIGVPASNTRNGRAGRVELYLGRTGYYPTTPDRVYEGTVAGDEFGFAVSTAGDLDDDGYDDFLVGAPGNDTDGVNSGRVYLYFGGSSPPTAPVYSWGGDLPNGRMGEALAGGFDFNDDGYGDFAVGAPVRNDTSGGGLRAGMVRIYFGSDEPADVQLPYTYTGDQANWTLGYSIDPAGDLDDDGYDDLVIGAPQIYDFNPGRAVVIFGQSSDFFAPRRVDIVGELGGDKFGWDVSGAGDLNGDGYDDLVVGAPDHDASGADRGAIYVFHGGSSFDGDYDWMALGGQGGDRLGAAVDGGFDLSGDGVPDLAAGAPRSTILGSNSGEVRLFLGGADMNEDADFVLLPDAPIPSYEAGDEFGSAVRFVGSFNGYGTDEDGHAELVASAPPGNSSSGSTAGYVNFIVNPDSYVPVRVLSFTAETAAAGAVVRWRLADQDDLGGVCVDAVRDGMVEPVHAGWLDPRQASVEDPAAGPGTTGYRLMGRDREGGVALLAETSYAGAWPRLALGAPDRNPFRDRVTFRAFLPGGESEVAVWDVGGRRVRVLHAGRGEAAGLDLAWDGRDEGGRSAPAGIYFVHATAGSRRASLKLIRLP